MARDVKRIYFDTDVAMKTVPKVCGAGCSHCCHQNIRIHGGEGPAIDRYITEELDQATRAVVKQNLAAWLEYFDKVTPGRLAYVDVLAFEQRITKDRVPCFFLIDGRCSIYRARPLVCRTHSVNDSAEACAADRHRNGDEAGLDIQRRKFSEISKAVDAFSIRLLAYSVQEALSLNHRCKPVTIPANLTLQPGA